MSFTKLIAKTEKKFIAELPRAPKAPAGEAPYP